VRGLAAKEQCIQVLEPALGHILKVLYGRVYSILERWCDRASSQDDEVIIAAKLRAHLAYLFRDVEASELTTRVVSTLLSSQIFLTTRHNFSLDARRYQSSKREESKKNEASMEEWSLEISDSEVFDLFQKHRAKIYKWLLDNPTDAN